MLLKGREYGERTSLLRHPLHAYLLAVAKLGQIHRLTSPHLAESAASDQRGRHRRAWYVVCDGNMELGARGRSSGLSTKACGPIITYSLVIPQRRAFPHGSVIYSLSYARTKNTSL